MQVKIYFAEKPVYLCNELTPALRELLHHPEAVFIDEASTAAINSLLHEIKKPGFHAGVVLSDDLEKLKKSFFKHFTKLEAAGGIVQNDAREILFILRHDKWDLPKGKMEKKEKPETCAMREVEEETGVKNLLLKKKVGETYHTYNEFGKHILKTTHWFYFTCKKQDTVPQIEEGISEIQWFKTRDIKKPIQSTYENIKDILAVFFDEP